MARYTAVISSAAEELGEKLKKDFDTVCLPADPILQAPVSSHADMLVFSVEDSVFVPCDYYSRNEKLFDLLAEKCGLKILPTECERGAEYPYDVVFNVLMCGNTAFSLKKYTAMSIVKALEDGGYRHINIKQGYAACSTLSLGKAVVTADLSVASACGREGIDSLIISPGNISLPGYDYGFIGGASGVCEDTVYFAGNIEAHPECKKIREFLSSHGFSCVSLSDGQLTDVGGIKFFKNRK